MKTQTDKLLKIRIVRFALTGGLATAIHIGVAFLCLHFIKDSVFYANVMGFSVAFGFSYIAQSLLVFKRPIRLMSAVKFFAVQFSALMASQLISESFSDLNSYLRVVMVVVILPIITYIVHKLWTFSSTNAPLY